MNKNHGNYKITPPKSKIGLNVIRGAFCKKKKNAKKRCQKFWDKAPEGKMFLRSPDSVWTPLLISTPVAGVAGNSKDLWSRGSGNEKPDEEVWSTSLRWWWFPCRKIYRDTMRCATQKKGHSFWRKASTSNSNKHNPPKARMVLSSTLGLPATSPGEASSAGIIEAGCGAEHGQRWIWPFRSQHAVQKNQRSAQRHRDREGGCWRRAAANGGICGMGQTTQRADQKYLGRAHLLFGI